MTFRTDQSGQVDEQKTPQTSGLLLSVEPLHESSVKLSAGDDSSDTSNDSSDTSNDSGSKAGDDTGTDTDTDLTDALGGDDSSDSDSSDDSGVTEITIDTKKDAYV